jgi:hypothetical protein
MEVLSIVWEPLSLPALLVAIGGVTYRLSLEGWFIASGESFIHLRERPALWRSVWWKSGVSRASRDAIHRQGISPRRWC